MKNNNQITAEEIKETAVATGRPVQINYSQAMDTFAHLYILTDEQKTRPVQDIQQHEWIAARRRGIVKWCNENNMDYREEPPDNNFLFWLRPVKKDAPLRQPVRKYNAICFALLNKITP
jgi:hypothetical protein